QWKKNNQNINGATARTYTTPPTVIGDNGAVFSVSVTDNNGTTNSAGGTLTVTRPSLSITTPPANQTVSAGQRATFSVTAAGTGNLRYQWRKNGVNIAGATARNYTTPNTAFGDNGALYSVVVTDTYGSIVTSTAATLTVNSRPIITQAPSPLVSVIKVGQTKTYSLQAIGSPTITYQWYFDGRPVTGATTNSYTTPAQATPGLHLIYCVVRNAFGSVTTVNLQIVTR
ncbi:MAG: chemotaxis protein, partial [Proteobacteria bacterium]|nr:chemotaxis protein [Pseudomonadota bacterium]